jgi:hypothetical protein
MALAYKATNRSKTPIYMIPITLSIIHILKYLLINYLLTIILAATAIAIFFRLTIDIFTTHSNQIFASIPDFICDFSGSQYFNTPDFLDSPIRSPVAPPNTPRFFIGSREVSPATTPLYQHTQLSIHVYSSDSAHSSRTNSSVYTSLFPPAEHQRILPPSDLLE